MKFFLLMYQHIEKFAYLYDTNGALFNSQHADVFYRDIWIYFEKKHVGYIDFIRIGFECS